MQEFPFAQPLKSSVAQKQGGRGKQHPAANVKNAATSPYKTCREIRLVAMSSTVGVNNSGKEEDHRISRRNNSILKQGRTIVRKKEGEQSSSTERRNRFTG